ncbi:FCD domain-containing protein [Telmatospirillum sp.]|uniref:FadR/GntR family transcriptional regulator n=1 Tax=Telmatospirillum sp. TaxID=2079197 RepID=UPI00283C72D8|nr:FCD domain-containing protein [Telmatospirillum sp.]MDR3440522.1 FCD domain-containing protein [Telmatospirillum sp.]
MVFQAVRPPRLSDAIADQIRDLIYEGALPPGTRMPSERELAERFDTSRPTVRSALAKLDSEGLLQMQRDGLHVNDPMADNTAVSLTALYEGRPERFDDYLEFRLIIEREATYFAALRATTVDRDNISRCFEKLMELHEQSDAGSEAQADADFHLAIYEASHNMTILHVMRGMAGLLRNDVIHNRSRLHPRTGYHELNGQQHRAIYDAVMAGSPDAARAAAHTHIALVREFLDEMQKATDRLETSLRRMASKAQLGQPDSSDLPPPLGPEKD